MLDVVASMSPTLLPSQCRAMFKEYADSLAQRAKLAKQHWTPMHGGSSWQDYLQKLYVYAWKAYNCEPQDTDIVIVDSEEAPVVYFVSRCNCQLPVKSTSSETKQ